MKAKILVLDDEESIRFSFDRVLAAEGYKVSTVASYDAALVNMDATQFDLILADIILTDGYRYQHSQGGHAENHQDQGDHHDRISHHGTEHISFRLKAVDYLIKPLRRQDLLDAVAIALVNPGGAPLAATSAKRDMICRQARHTFR